jgi:hypothetical protein
MTRLELCKPRSWWYVAFTIRTFRIVTLKLAMVSELVSPNHDPSHLAVGFDHAECCALVGRGG